jgi:uncharacterized protein DUF4129
MMRLPPAKKARAALLFGALISLEAAPVSAWLVVYAAAESGDIRLTAAPFWLVVGVLLVFAGVRWSAVRLGPLALTAGWVVCGVASALALIRFSPLGYGDLGIPIWSFSWLGDLGGALAAGAQVVDVTLGLSALTIYLGWRGARLGEGGPLFSHISRRFSIGMGAVILAVFGSLASAPGSMRPASAALLALLALEGFAGLSALAISRPRAGSGRTDATAPGAEYSSRWEIAAGAIALLIVAGVAFVGGLLNITAMPFLFSWLAPVADILNRFGSWLTQSIAYVLYLISVYWLSHFIPGNLPNQPIHVPRFPQQNGPARHTQTIPGQFVSIATVIVVVLVVVGVLIALYLVARGALRTLNKPASDDNEEERERLDASSLLRQQTRDLLDRWRRAGGGTAVRDELQRGSVRWLYRELLRAGARAGHERQASETADEYAARLAEALHSDGRTAGDPVADDLRALAYAYDDARYGSIEDDPPASSEVAEQSRRMTERVGALDGGPAQRRR